MKQSKRHFRIRILCRIRRIIAILILVSTLTALCGIGGIAAFAVKLQFIPALLRGIGEFSIGGIAIAGSILAGTFLCGRFYCAMLCPLGVLQEGIGMLDRRRKKPSAAKDLPQLRYPIAGVVFVLAFCCGNWGFTLLDPYTVFGRIFGAFLRGGFLPLVLLTALVLWKRRTFCTAICPAGTVLGLAAGHGLLQLRFRDSCVHCGKCAQVCPAGCISPAEQTVDQERCLRCLKCLEVCPKDALTFARHKAAPAQTDAARRRFLRQGAFLLGGIAGGVGLLRLGAERLLAFRGRTGILPPGAGSKERFASKCTGCQLCVQNCPEKILVPAPGGTGPVTIDPTRGACRFDCNRCSQVCPVGALTPLPLAKKQRTQIAVAKFNARFCKVYQEDEVCGKCAQVCPVGAAKLRATGAPFPIDAARCIGCGKCYQACPAAPKAISMEEVEKQQLLPENSGK